MGNKLRTQHFWIDSSTMGDVIGVCRNVLLRTKRPSKLTVNPRGRTLGKTLAARYGQIGRPAKLYPPGRRRNYAPPYSSGIAQSILALGKSREVRALSRDSQLGDPSLDDIWQRESQLPMFSATQTRPALSDQNRHLWGAEVMGGNCRRWIKGSKKTRCGVRPREEFGG